MWQGDDEDDNGLDLGSEWGRRSQDLPAEDPLREGDADESDEAASDLDIDSEPDR